VQGDTPSSVKAEIAHEIKLDSITDEDWEISIVSVIGKGHSEAPKSSSEETLPAPGRKYLPHHFLNCHIFPNSISSKLIKTLTIILIFSGQRAKEEKEEGNQRILLQDREEFILLLLCARSEVVCEGFPMKLTVSLTSAASFPLTLTWVFKTSSSSLEIQCKTSQLLLWAARHFL